ncbi:hypothetical protein BDFB_001730 [Asbolus verrucosus]|uniref:Uncharacterized protein n=1 Tax=Asbolus verrucosus TaxID=1661398 RepID=A0A482VAB5_ASBVE|nr:hypothetical protein BDFB_001730 [Asbolus verrucosus]
MSVLDERDEYKSNPYFQKPEYGDFTPFYITVTICTIIGVSIFILNVVLGCCSRYSNYWNDRHTGNRWIASLWTATPHQQPPLDLTELKAVQIPHQIVYLPPPSEKVEYRELQKRESDI